MAKNLNEIVTKTASNWKKQAKQDRINRRNISRSQVFALELMEYMDLHKIKQVDLAKKMGVSAQQVNKILSAKANLTFETLDKIANALEVNISSPKIISIKSAQSPLIQYPMQIVHKRKHMHIEENIISERIIKKNPVLNTTLESMDLYSYTANQI